MTSPVLEMKGSEAQRSDVFCPRSVAQLGFKRWLRDRKYLIFSPLLTMDPRGWVGNAVFLAQIKQQWVFVEGSPCTKLAKLSFQKPALEISTVTLGILQMGQPGLREVNDSPKITQQACFRDWTRTLTRRTPKASFQPFTSTARHL